MSFRLKTIFGIALIESILLFVLILSGLNFLTDSNENQLQQRASSTINLFAAATQDAIISTDLATLESALSELAKNPEITYARILRDDIVLAEFGEDSILNIPRAIDTSYQFVDDGLYDVKTDIIVAGQVLGSIEIGLSTRFLDDIIILAKQSALSLALIEIILVAVFSFILGTYLTRQLNLLKDASDNITQSGPGHQVTISGHDEIAAVAKSFNVMSQHIKESHDQLNRSLKLEQKMVKLAARNEAMNKAIVDASLDANITINSDGYIIEFSRIAEHIFGWDKQDIIGKQLSETIIPKKYREAHEMGLKHYMKTGEGPVLAQRIEIEGLHKNGTVFPIELTISPISDDEVIYFTSFIRDLTTFKKKEDEHKEARQLAEQANKAKSRFLATMSHEIRSPLNAIVSMNELLLETNLNEKQQEMVQTINNGGDILLSLISDILDFSKIESGTLKLEQEWFDLAKMIKQTINLLSNELHLSSIDINTVIDPTLYTQYFGDKPRMRQVLINLFSNAVKFTATGFIKVTLKHNLSRNGIVLSVKDSGIGIDKTQQAHIFKEFHQVEEDDNRRFMGTGLGLSIVYQLVKMMKGNVQVHSEKDQGSEFVVTLPLMGNNEQYGELTQELKVLPVSTFKDKMILIAEDSKTNQTIIQSTLEKFGCLTLLASNGIEAIEQCHKHVFDLILMDLAMPEMDGITATQLIRKESKENKNTTIIAITANAFAEDKQRCLEAGMNDFVTKPIKIDSFRQTVAHWMETICDEKPLDQPKLNALIDENVVKQLEHDTSPDILPKILQIFIEETQQRVDTIEQLDKQKDYVGMTAEAHTLKSSSGSFGAAQLQNLAKKIEIEAKNNDVNALRKSVDSLRMIVDQSIDRLKILIQTKNG